MAPGASAQTTDDVYRAGMVVRREVLGDAHVERAVAFRIAAEVLSDFDGDGVPS